MHRLHTLGGKEDQNVPRGREVGGGRENKIKCTFIISIGVIQIQLHEEYSHSYLPFVDVITDKIRQMSQSGAGR